MSGGSALLKSIKQEPRTETAHNTRKRQILVNFGLGRKKIFPLDGSTSLKDQFKVHVNMDPAFSKLLKKSFLVFQEYNVKFGTWVDIDDEDLSDGAVVNAVFFPKTIETDERNPGAVKRKREEFEDIPASKRPRVLCGEGSLNSSSISVVCKENGNVEQLEKSVINGHIQNNHKNKEHHKKVKNSKGKKIENVKNSKGKIKNVKNSKQKKLASKKKQQVKSKCTPSVSSVSLSAEEKKHYTTLMQHENYFNSTASDVAISNTRNLNKPKYECSEEQHKISSIEQEIKKITLPSYQKTTLANSNTKVDTTAPEWKIIDLAKWYIRHNVDMTGFMEQRWNYVPEMKYSKEEWKKFIFSGISHFSVQSRCIKRLCSNSSQKESPHQMFWGSVSCDGTVIISTVNNSVTAKALGEILKKFLFPFIDNSFPRGGAKLQYYRSLHTQHESKLVSTLLKEKKITHVEWPDYIRDINPLEHVWDYIAKKVENIPCSNINDMISVIYDVWSEDHDIPLMCNKFVSSMQDIIRDLGNLRGSYLVNTITW